METDRARAALDAVIAAMERCGLWDVARPTPEAFAETAASGQRTMTFAQWLRWVFVPRVEELMATGGPWPASSSIAAAAIREADRNSVLKGLVQPLAALEALLAPAEELDGLLAMHQAGSRRALAFAAVGPGCVFLYEEGERHTVIAWDPRNDDVLLYLPFTWTSPPGRPIEDDERGRMVDALWTIAQALDVGAVVEHTSGGPVARRWAEDAIPRLEARGVSLDAFPT